MQHPEKVKKKREKPWPELAALALDFSKPGQSCYRAGFMAQLGLAQTGLVWPGFQLWTRPGKTSRDTALKCKGAPAWESQMWTRLGNTLSLVPCALCICTKTQRCRLIGKLHPLPIPEAPWNTISINFIVELPIMDSMNKMAHFILTFVTILVARSARLFIQHVWKHHSLS